MARPASPRTVRAPEKGSFPLDHLNECRGHIEEYFRCLTRNDNLAPKCREETRAYLNCRMDKELMDKEETLKWLPTTEFVDTRYKKHEQKMEQSQDLPPGAVALQLRQQPDGFERPREGATPADERSDYLKAAIGDS